ncbi:MAG: DUF4271 domain-containing protein [Muribaculaceae bacterium]|nr:DUF4271 domain-containing protein [Muribaculaceae bacterium]
MPTDSVATLHSASASVSAPHASQTTSPASTPADTVLRMPRHAAPRAFDADLEHALDAAVDVDRLDMSSFTAIVEQASQPPAWTQGHNGDTRIIHPAGHSVVLGMLALLSVACMLAYSHFGRALSTSVQNLWSVRRRQNAFDESSPGRKRVGVLLALQFAAYSGVLLYAAIRPGQCTDATAALTATLRLAALAACYYVFQLSAYGIVGYTFAPDISKSRQWLDGFIASQGLAGVVLALPTLGLVFYPEASEIMLIAAATVYIAARLIFIGKGFRIFYTGPASLVYFILYLCTLEIVPAIAIYALSMQLAG